MELFLKKTAFRSLDETWAARYLSDPKARITFLLKDWLGNPFWKNYAAEFLRAVDRNDLLLRVKYCDAGTIHYTQVWRDVAVYRAHLNEAIGSVDIKGLLADAGISVYEETSMIASTEVPTLIASLRRHPHVLQVICPEWRLPDMILGDPLKIGDGYLPFPERKN